jgi:hypothetical protein
MNLKDVKRSDRMHYQGTYLEELRKILRTSVGADGLRAEI